MTSLAEHRQHVERQQQLKEQVQSRVAAATEQRGIVIIYTGNGKGKTTAAMGTVSRALGYGMTVGIVQFIKGRWETGEYNFLSRLGAEFHLMGTGFTWETQDREGDIQAARKVWAEAKRMLADPNYNLVVLDELTYMVTFEYLGLDEILAALSKRPIDQTVIITGRNCDQQLISMADTVSELQPVKHAFENGIKAQQGIDW